MNNPLKQGLLHTGLFIATFITVTLTGAFMYSAAPPPEDFAINWELFKTGLPFSIPFLGILLVHELGHYFTAIARKVKTSLPYFIPFFPYILGTMGAVIVMKGPRNSRKQYFDIGIAGPLAGWIVAIGVLWYGYATLPPIEHIFELHPEYQEYGADFADHVYAEPGSEADTLNQIYFGTNLTMQFFEKVVADPDRVPPRQEIMHYPLLMAGFWALFFTALNLLPIGQLDGGHVIYGLVGGRRQRWISGAVFLGFLTYAGVGVVTPSEPSEELLWKLPLYLGFLFIALHSMKLKLSDRLMIALGILAIQYVITLFNPAAIGFQGWLLFGLIIGRFLGVYHPTAPLDAPLSRGRQILGWIALIIFIISFSPEPVWLVGPGYTSP